MTATPGGFAGLVGSGSAPSLRPSPSAPRPWLLAARPKTLPAAAAPVLLGTACAAAVGGFRLGPAVASLVGALLLQVAANFVNDVADFTAGTDTSARLGPLRVTQAGLLTPHQVWAGVVVVVLAACAVGLYLTAVAGWPVLAIGGASIAAALAYSVGPCPLARHGLGEPFVMAFFGVAAVAGTAYVQALTVPAAAWWGGLVAGAFATAILVVNNTRDHATDRAAGRRTIPARWGRRAGVAEYRAFLLLAYLGSLGMVASGAAPPTALAALLTVPLARRLAHRLATCEDGPTANRVLAGTGGLLLLHCLLLSAGLVVGSPQLGLIGSQ